MDTQSICASGHDAAPKAHHDDLSRSLREKILRGSSAGWLPAWTPSRRRSIDRDILEAWTLVMGREAAVLWLADRARRISA